MPQFRNATATRAQSVLVAHGVLHTPSTQRAPAAHIASLVQKGRGRVSGAQ